MSIPHMQVKVWSWVWRWMRCGHSQVLKSTHAGCGGQKTRLQGRWLLLSLAAVLTALLTSCYKCWLRLRLGWSVGLRIRGGPTLTAWINRYELRAKRPCRVLSGSIWPCVPALSGYVDERSVSRNRCWFMTQLLACSSTSFFLLINNVKPLPNILLDDQHVIYKIICVKAI